jgi:hypothetical protein
LPAGLLAVAEGMLENLLNLFVELSLLVVGGRLVEAHGHALHEVRQSVSQGSAHQQRHPLAPISPYLPLVKIRMIRTTSPVGCEACELEHQAAEEDVEHRVPLKL